MITIHINDEYEREAMREIVHVYWQHIKHFWDAIKDRETNLKTDQEKQIAAAAYICMRVANAIGRDEEHFKKMQEEAASNDSSV